MRNAIPLTVLFFTVGLLLLLIFGDAMLHPNQYLYGHIEDGVKNYYTVAWYVNYDQGLWFSGMNYPFGEHITFTDNQPVLAFFLKQISKVIPSVKGQGVGIVNLAMLLSIALAACFIYLILRKLKLPGWYAFLLALLIAFLSPQHFRIRAHYALAHAFIIPMYWYMAIRILENPKQVRWYIIYSLSVLIAGFIHPYYLLINVLFLLAYTLVYYWQQRKKEGFNFKIAGGLVLTAVVPVFVFQTIMVLTDQVAGRPGNPYGFIAFRTSFKAIFLPLEDPLKSIYQSTFHTTDAIWEGYAYVGQMGLLALILILIKAGRYLLKKHWDLFFRPVLPQPLRIGVWAALLVLIFSLGIPVRWGLEGLLDIIPPLKQFRSIGRFAWVFYYIYTVYIAYLFYQIFRLLRYRQKPVIAAALLAVVLLIWSAEAYININTKAKIILQNKITEKLFQQNGKYTQLLRQNGFTPSDFQAILPFPYFHVGSEKISINRSEPILTESMKMSLNTGLPIVSTLLSRTSINQTLKQVQLLSTDQTPKEILQDYPSAKPLLLLVYHDSLTSEEKNLIKKAHLITRQPKFSLYKLLLDSLQAKPHQLEAAAHFSRIKPSLIRQNNLFVSDTSGTIIFNNFSEKSNGKWLFQEGSLTLKNGKYLLTDTIIAVGPRGKTYEGSVWAYIKEDYLLPVIKLDIFSHTTNQTTQSNIRFNESVEVYKGWVRADVIINLAPGRNKVLVEVKGKKIMMDSFLLRPVGTDVFFYGSDKSIIKNNRFMAPREAFL